MIEISEAQVSLMPNHDDSSNDSRDKHFLYQLKNRCVQRQIGTTSV